MANASAVTNVTPIATGNAASVPETKKTRERDDIGKAGTLARAIRKADDAINAEKARHETRLKGLTDKREELELTADGLVLTLAKKLLAAE